MASASISRTWSARIQIFCDTLGKWMTAQAFVLVLMMVAFKYNIKLDERNAAQTQAQQHAATGATGATGATALQQPNRNEAFGSVDISLEPVSVDPARRSFV